VPPRQVNSLAIASLIFGVIGGVLFSVILGFVALSQISRRGERGRGLAIAGLSLSGVWVLVIATFVAIGVAGGESTAASEPTQTVAVPAERTTGPGHRYVEHLQLGDCLGDIDENTGDEFTVKLCSERHGGEVYDIWYFPAGAYPGSKEVEQQAGDRCHRAFGRYAAGEFADASLFYLFPSRESWSDDRRVVCIAVPEKDPWTGSMVHP
jgi:hypothetical protein